MLGLICHVAFVSERHRAFGIKVHKFEVLAGWLAEAGGENPSRCREGSRGVNAVFFVHCLVLEWRFDRAEMSSAPHSMRMSMHIGACIS